MKIRQQVIDHAKVMAWLDKNVGFRPARLDEAVRMFIARGHALPGGRFRSGIFEGSHDRCSHSKDGPGIASRVADCFRRLFRNLVPLRMHFVLFDFFFMNRLESAQANIERDGSDLDTTLLDLIEYRGRKMQPCGGRRDSSGALSENGLVTLAVRWLIAARNAGGQRN